MINEDGSVSTNATLAANPNAAQWVSPSAFVASSLETGRIGYIVAWGGKEFGYAYTYALSGAPAGVTIDPDTGILSIASPLAVRAYGFSVIVTNREVVTNVATFPITLTILQGVTANRTGSQILHKTYDPHSGIYGSPSGTDWTAVLLNIQKAIIADQVAAGDDNLRATITLRKGVTYQYTQNDWLTGIKYFRIINDPAFPSGAIPNLQNITTSFIFDHEKGALYGGGGSAFVHEDNKKAFCALIHSASEGATTVTLTNLSDARKIVAGRWHTIVGQCQQIGGYPPNVTYCDYVKVLSVVGSTVTLDRPLRHAYSSNWWEDPSDDGSFGKARIVPFDLGGAGGAVPSDARCTKRGQFFDVVFLANPNVSGMGAKILTQQWFVDMQFDGVTIPSLTVSQSAHVLCKNCTIAGGEPDKIIETLIFDGGTTGELGQASGVEYWLSRGTTHGSLATSPRQMRTINATLDATGDNYTIFPWVASYNGPLMEFDFEATTFRHGLGHKEWTATEQTATGNPNTPRLVIPRNATWSGNRLIIPRSWSGFEDWLTAVYPGFIISTGNVPIAPPWAYVSAVSAPSDGSALWLDTVWTGTKPTSGTIYRAGRFRRLIMKSNCVFVSPTTFASPGFMSETSAAFGTSYAFPAGYPEQYR